MKLYPFYSALSQCYELYGIELDEDIFETYARSAYRRIGNKITKMKIFRATPEKDCDNNWYVQLPCDCEYVEAVTLPFEDAQLTSNKINRIGWLTQTVEEAIESTKKMPNELYIPGKYVKFREIGDKLYFTEPFHLINILYKGSFNDGDGLPLITEKEANAIATYCAYCHFYKQGLSTKDNATIQMAAMLKRDWSQACSAARIPEKINQNEMNEVLDVMASYNRHMFGRTTKPIY